MNASLQRFCAWSGVLYIATFCVAMIGIAHFIPPTPPAWNAAQVAIFYREHSLGIRAATALMIFTVPLGFSWTTSMAAWTGRMEAGMPLLSWTQLMCGVFTFGGAYIGSIFFSSGAFRATRPDELILMASDQGWYWMIMPGSCAVMQCIFIGIAILSDNRQAPLFPRWVGFFNIWVGVLQIPGVMIPFFKTGPFAWNGVFAFWIPLSVFSLWIYVDTWALLRAIKREEAVQILQPA